ncbi:excalibur calcium-binding domain-containing protein [Paractinoplanes deccanensis]|uniref:excalibur calcium-binding domain-containing protein n=1 Tax=Paractinoplanes deccanensis TaxID=113561 RepID=UPI0019430A66|nr:excalibur calcium-binding domain-containing protein [Actinoplanes deccanensis]
MPPAAGYGPYGHGAAANAYGSHGLGAPADGYGTHGGAYGPPVNGYGPGAAAAGPPTQAYGTVGGLPVKPPSRWKAWHKVTLGVVGVLVLCLCGVAVFAPDSDPNDKDQPEQTAAAQDVAEVPTTLPAAPTTTAPTSAAPATTQAAKAPATTKPTPTRKPTTKPTTKKAVYYATCAEAPGPLRVGDPGYRKGLDRDGDGVACERGGGDADEPVEEPTAEDPGDSDGGGTDPRFSTCTKAKAAGYGPYTQGEDPEYDWYDDRDNDGVVCE